MKNTITTTQTCPCGGGRNYQICCQDYLERTAQAPTAEALMRSRYTAFTLQNERYLRYSWHPDTCPQNIQLNENTKWLGLKILKVVAGSVNDDTGTVEFIARSKVHGKAQRIHENSRFSRIEGRWVYVDGGFLTK